MKALHSDELDEALTIIDRAHSQPLHDREHPQFGEERDSSPGGGNSCRTVKRP
jgi:hypothetical protein